MNDNEHKVTLTSVMVKRPYSLYYVYILDGDCILSLGTSLSKWGAKRVRNKMLSFWRQFYYNDTDKIEYDRDVVFQETQSHKVIVDKARKPSKLVRVTP